MGNNVKLKCFKKQMVQPIMSVIVVICSLLKWIGNKFWTYVLNVRILKCSKFFNITKDFATCQCEYNDYLRHFCDFGLDTKGFSTISKYVTNARKMSTCANQKIHYPWGINLKHNFQTNFLIWLAVCGKKNPIILVTTQVFSPNFLRTSK